MTAWLLTLAAKYTRRALHHAERDGLSSEAKERIKFAGTALEDALDEAQRTERKAA